MTQFIIQYVKKEVITEPKLKKFLETIFNEMNSRNFSNSMREIVIFAMGDKNENEKYFYIEN